MQKEEQKKFMREVKDESKKTWQEISLKLNVSKQILYAYLRGSSKIPLKNYYLLCSISNIEPNDNFNKIIIKNRPQEIKLPKEITTELSELIGILAGDGHISKRQYHISVTGHRQDDYDFINRHIFDLFLKLFSIKGRFQFQDRNNSIKIIVNSKQLFEFLINKFKLPVGKKKGKLKIPKKIIESDLLLRMYLRGLFDTDGSVYLRREKSIVVNYSSRDSQFLDQVQFALRKLGFSPSKSGKNIYLYRQEEIKKFFNEIGSSNKKHTSRYDNFINKNKEV